MNRLILLITITTISMIAKSQDYCNSIQNIQNYQDEVRLIRSGEFDIIDPNTFNIETYLSKFDNILVEKGYNIETYFFDNFLNGNPYLCALKNNQKLKGENTNSFYTFLNKPEVRAKNHISPKDSEIGFLQYLFFCEMGEQFALKWHSNYNEKYIICSNKKLDEVITEFRKNNQPKTEEEETTMPAFGVNLEELDKVSQINPAIEIDFSNEYCSITWIENRTHSGFYKCKYKIQRKSPYIIEKINEERLLGIMIGFLY